MALEKYKVCPACGEHNPPVLLECKKCETDLTGVKVVDSASELSDTLEKEDSAKVDTQQELVKICDCGAHNPPQARKCISCGEDISDIRPTATFQKQNIYALQSVSDDYSFVIDKPVTIIGREAEMQDYLAQKPYVSRQHAKFTIVGNEVFIENLSSTNHTFVNNALISKESPTLLKEGDEIGLGGKVIDEQRQANAAYFIFKVTS
ncbi:50S ribosomal protein L40e [Pelotomaculum schinkii]|uniref:50S ribosomal protein L40e n=1 Tax=Pelotomaculum schinkii TaxID=78350 RepID=A0A4Y7RG86_9FIRM|nr:FHA domain-containing protein [Pelotomaculum schinkii]TEB07769.1 50S ribosomal protein L40e [Pelotomaculum schinkii]